MAATLDKAKVKDKEWEAIQRFRQRRNKCLRELDMEYARVVMPAASSDFVRLISMHKARYECTDIEPELRQESRAWLEERKYSRLQNLEWPAVGELPA